jgi:transcriptional regulator GlxA family with amidase domain
MGHNQSVQTTYEAAQATPTRIALLVPPNAVAMSVALGKDLLWIAAARAGRREGIDHSVRLITLDGAPARCGGGTVISADAAIDEAGDVELVYLAAFWGDAEAAIAACAPALPWLREQHARGALIAAPSTASLLAAAAGLLDGRLATTYPPAVSDFRRLFPAVDLQPHRALTGAGRVYCAAGINSGCDLAVSLIERLFGRSVARAIADEFLVDFHRAYRVASVAFDGQKYHGDEAVLAVQLWLESQYDRPIVISQVASRFSLTPRTLARRFRSATGELPSEYLRRVRMAVAEDLLRDAGLTVAEAAERVGYSNVGAFSDAFLRESGARPGAARQPRTVSSAPSGGWQNALRTS